MVQIIIKQLKIFNFKLASIIKNNKKIEIIKNLIKFDLSPIKKDNKIQCKIYDNKKNIFDVNGETDDSVDISNILMKGSQIKAVLKCNGIWLANGKFGCTWRAEQIRVKVPEGGLNEFAIESESDDDDYAHFNIIEIGIIILVITN